MALRWLHKSWSALWSFLGITVSVIILLAIIIFGLLQLPFSKALIVQKIENQFNNSHHGVLKLGEFTGVLPINFHFKNVHFYADSTSIEPIFSSDTVSASLDFWALISSKFVINSLTINSPELKISDKTDQSIFNAIKKKNSILNKSDSIENSTPFLEILAPTVTIKNGYISILTPFPELENGVDSLTIRDMNMEMFLDYGKEGRFLDIEKLEFIIPELDLGEINVFGQVFNNEQFLELNAFNISFGNSALRFSSEAENVDLLKEDLLSQFKSSKLNIDIDELRAESSLIKRIYSDYPDIENGVSLSLNAGGDLDSLWIDDFEFLFGESATDGYGYIKTPFNKNTIAYNLELFNILVDSSEIILLTDALNDQQLQTLITSRYNVKINGDKNFIKTQIEFLNQKGTVVLDTKLQLKDNFPLTLTAALDGVDLGGLVSENIQSTDLSGKLYFETSNLKNYSTSQGNTIFKFRRGSYNKVEFDSVNVEADWENGIITPSFSFITPNAFLTGMGTINIQDSIPAIEFSGKGKNLDVKELTQIKNIANAYVDVEYDLFLSGSNQKNIYGQVSLDIPFSIINGDTLANHQFYADFSEPSLNKRNLRVTSTAFDVSMDGNFEPLSIIQLAPYWVEYFNQRKDEEILLLEPIKSTLKKPIVLDQNFNIDFRMKNFGLFRAYIPSIPRLETNSKIVSNFTVNADRLLFNSTINDPKLIFNTISMDSLSLQLTGSFRRGETLKSFGSLEAEAIVGKLETDLLVARQIDFSFDMNDDSIAIKQNIKQLGENALFNFEGFIGLKDSSVNLTINTFSLGSETYNWENSVIPSLSFKKDSRLEFNNFIFSNQNEFIGFDGVLSNAVSDSMNYEIRSVNLARISELINGRINFSGNLDGSFTTKSLTRIPSIQGNLNIAGFGIDDNVVGDIFVNSIFNQELDRFDTNISIQTDSTKYPQYYVRNNREGQDIKLNGYVLAPVNGEFPNADSLFKFDLDFENIDLWIIPFIAPKVFSEMSGKATGHGYVWGNLDTYDFSVDYGVGLEDAVYMKPRFLDTYYYGQGLITFSRSNGLVFKDVFVLDPSGGTAILSGNYNYNDFQPIHDINLQIEMDEFQFLNNDFEPTLPFFGKAYGTSTIRLTGTNENPILSTVDPIYISDFSNIGIPLLEETDFDEDNKFIRFVNNFTVNESSTSNNGSSFNSFTSQVERDPASRTFVERFTLDLQFIANNPMTVRLIFDPVTGDIITTNGTGRLRIRLQDEDFSMFGRFDITGGDYQFVSGDIFTRRFELERGGTIIWEGSPTDARLDLNAVYEARPDINTLTSARSDINQETSQRVPVQLVLNIGGSLEAIQNNFFFRLPNTFESRQNTTLSTQINTLNRNEDEKLLQATSFLLMGDFIPSTSATTDGTNSLTSNFSGSGAVLNPLLSSQVINPLLSNQINSLLRSDIGSLDIDFNLNTYNNVDLGVALRLYNDRIILSREGQITGAQSNIGDLGATYRINQTLSVTAFHRRDPTFSGFGGSDESQQAQDINGVGLEAEVSFNSWNEFFRKLANPFKKLFGIRDKEEQPEIADDQNPII